jgi:hypothetical protein
VGPLLETLVLIGIALFTYISISTLYVWIFAKRQGKSITTYLDDLEKNLKEQSESK